MSAVIAPMVVVAPNRLVTIKLASQLTGLTVKAIESKIARAVWIEGRHYRKRDGNIYIDLKEIDRWVEKGTA